MTITVGDTLPEATFLEMSDDGPKAVASSDLFNNRRVVVFGLPGAFTGTCDQAHLPSFIRTADEFRAKGIDEIICVSVNDPFVMKAWGDSRDTAAAGIRMLGDAECAFTEALGMRIDVPPAGLIARSGRYALIAENGKVTHLHHEDNPGVCETSGGESLLEELVAEPA